MKQINEARKKYSLFKNLCLLFVDIRYVGYQYYGYLIADIIISVGIPLLLVLLPGNVVGMLQGHIAYEQVVIRVFIWIGAILLLNLIRVFAHQKIDWMIRLLLQAHYERRIELYWLTCDVRKKENAEDISINDEIRSILFTMDYNSFSGIYGMYMYGIMFVINVCGFLIFAYMAGSVNIILMFILFVTSVLNCYAKKKGLRYQFLHMGKFWVNNNRFWYLKTECNNLEKAKDIRMFHLHDNIQSRLEENVEEAIKTYSDIQNHHMFSSVIVTVCSFVQNAVAYAFLLYQLINGTMQVAQFVVYIGVVAGFSTWIIQIVDSITNLTKINYSVSLFRTYVMDQTEEDSSNDPAPSFHSIECRDISFGYGDKMIFEHFSLTLHQNELIALVGMNGAGKSTLIKLLCGLYPVQEGKILLDGVDITTISPRKYREYMAILFQKVQVLPYSIAKNVSCACSLQECEQFEKSNHNDSLTKLFQKLERDHMRIRVEDEERVVDALKKAKLWDKVSSLPRGIHTILTQVMDAQGIRLSGGETQRLLLARALYKDAPILILDEPTSALDPIAESELYEEYAQLCHQKLSIFISHRLSSTRFCNRILFLENGKILEEGTHDELMMRNGHYAQMYQIQSHYYQKEVQKNEA